MTLALRRVRPGLKHRRRPHRWGLGLFVRGKEVVQRREDDPIGFMSGTRSRPALSNVANDARLLGGTGCHGVGSVMLCIQISVYGGQLSSEMARSIAGVVNEATRVLE